MNSSVFSISSQNFGENNEILLPLLAKAKQGSQGAFGEIYNLYFKKIYQFIFYRVSHKEIAEDLAEEVLNLQQEQIVLLKLIKELPSDQQLVIKLKFFEVLTNTEIAEALNKSEGAIRVIQHRGITKLQELLKNQVKKND